MWVCVSAWMAQFKFRTIYESKWLEEYGAFNTFEKHKTEKRQPNATVHIFLNVMRILITQMMYKYLIERICYDRDKKP